MGEARKGECYHYFKHANEEDRVDFAGF